MFVFILFWVAGWMLLQGIQVGVSAETDGWDILLCFLFWPILLGVFIGYWFSTEDDPDKN